MSLRRITGPPLDRAAAERRVEQLRALSDPLHLQLWSVIAVGDPPIAERLGVSDEDVEASVAHLTEVGLLERHDGALVASADAIVRFGRILATDPSRLHLDDPAVVVGELPPALAKVADDLAYRFSSVFAAETVRRYVAESHALLQSRARVTTHLASLTARFAADRLGALATAQGRTWSSTPEVLFVCVQNAGRSQIAAATLRHLVGDRVHVRTAGSAPAARVHQDIVDVLDEVGIPIAAEFPKPLTDEVVQAADVVVTMGCGDACPVLPGRRYLDWSLDDPVGLDREEQRRVRDEIRAHIEELVAELGVTPR